MRIDWAPLRTELSACRAAGVSVPLWWRDDDAVTATPALERLSLTAGALDMPVHLAVIPADADRALARHVESDAGLTPVVHGWSHRNHAPADAKKAEFGQVRPGGGADLQQGLVRLRTLFGDRLLPAFVAPWNRLHPGYLPELQAVGYRAVSTFAPRKEACPAPGLLAVNTHIDPIDWHGTRGLADPDRIIAQAVRHLRARREDHEDRREPLGYLTHHLVHTAEIWSFSHAFLTEMRTGGAQSMPLSHIMQEPT